MPIPLSLPHPRYERKFFAGEHGFSEVIALVRRHPAAFREAYPPRTVNNIYLDTPELRDYHDHVNGAAERTKTRVRWYGAWSGLVAAPTLEQKLKRGHVSGKISNRLAPLTMNGHVSRADLDAAFDGGQLPEWTRMALRHLLPSLLNRYRRYYFLSADGRFRLTVESGFQFAAARQVQSVEVAFSPPTSQVVIELKYGVDQDEEAAHVANALPFRLARCSKYVLGVASVAVC
jgi:hypothetical protein